MDSVGRDQQIAPRNGSIREPGGDTRLVLVERIEQLAGMVRVLWQRRSQQSIKTAPRGQHLRQRKLSDDSAVRIKHHTAGDDDTEALWLTADTCSRQHVPELGMRNDAGAAPSELGADALVDVDTPTRLAKQEGGEETAHGAADDNRSTSAS